MHSILNDKRYINLINNAGFDVWQRGTTLGGTFTGATTTASSTTVSGLSSVVTTLRTGMTVNGASLGGAKTISTITSNTALTLNSSTGVTTATGTAALQFGVPNGTYCADRWFVVSQTTGVKAAMGTGSDAEHCAVLTNNAVGVNQGFGIAQILGQEDTYGLRGSYVTLQLKVQNSNGGTVNAAILEWTGTADSASKSIVSDWTKTDLSTATASGKFFSYTTQVVTATNSVTPTAANTWTDLTVQGTVGATANNVIVFVWMTNVPSGSTLSVSQVGLYESPTALDWYPVLKDIDALACRRHFERVDLPASSVLANGFSSATTSAKATVKFTEKRSGATYTAGYVGLPADVSVTDSAGTQVGTAVATSLPSRHSCLVTVTVASGLTAGGGNIVIDSGNATHGAVELIADL